MKGKFSSIALAGILALTIGAVAGCSNPPAEHVHTFSAEWSDDETHHWHTSTCGHDVVSDEGEHVFSTNKSSLGYIGFCTVCGKYHKKTAAVDENISTTINQNETAVYRIPATTGKTEFGLWTEFNDHIENEGLAEVFTIVNNTPRLLTSGLDYESHLIQLPTGHDGYIYLVLSYEGTQPTAEFESVSVKSLLHGCDANANFYGKTISDFSDTHDLEDPAYRINGKYVFGVDVYTHGETLYEIEITNVDTSAPITTFTVYQAKNDYSGLRVVDLDEITQFFKPGNVEDLIVEVVSDVPGSSIAVTIVEHILSIID
jgi:hypothetical protein